MDSVSLEEENESPSFESSFDQEIAVLFTDPLSTQLALHTASQLARNLSARIRLLVPLHVPFPLPLDRPPRDLASLNREIQSLLESFADSVEPHPATVSAEIVLSRDPSQSLLTRLSPASVIVIGKRHRWWPALEDRITAKLQYAGHHVVRTSTPKGPLYA